MNQPAEPKKEMPNAVRYFLAIRLPEEAKDCLIAIQPVTVQGMRLIGREELHLTLHFLGELLPSEKVAVVRQAIAALWANAFSITIKGVGRFPADGQAQVLWSGVEASSDLLALYRSIGAVLTDTIGFQPERRPYAPHVTLARVGAPVSPSVIDQYLEKHVDFRIEPVRVEQIELYSSSFKEDVPHYAREAAFQLKRS